MTCRTCNGVKWVPGYWMPELFPECSGTGEEMTLHANEDKSDGDAIGFAIAVFGMLACIVAAVLWPVAEFLWSVLT